MPPKNPNRLLAAALALLPLASLHALAPNEWQHRQALVVEQAGVIKLALPATTLDLARPNLEDLRLLDAQGRETPFVVETAAPAVAKIGRAPQAFQVTMLNAATQLTIEVGDPIALDAVALVTPAPQFLKATRVEISADGRTWQTIHDGLPLFRQFGVEQLAIDLGGRTARTLRITVDDARARPVPFSGARLVLAPTTPRPVTTPLPVRIARREEFVGESVLTLDLGAKNIPLASLEFVTAESLFARSVAVGVRELRDDAAVERGLAVDAIYRVAADGLPPRAKLDVPLNFVAPARELLVHIRNGDSPLLAVDEVRIQQRPVWLVFRAEPGRYTVLTGNPDVSAPHYDLATLAATLREAAPASLTLGVPELNPDYHRPDALGATPLLGAALDPAPWTYRKAVHLVAAGVQELELDLDVLAHAQPGLPDLRLVRDGAQVPYLVERPALSRSSALRIAAASDPKRPRLSRWQLKLPRAGAPVARLTLASPTPLFQRHVRVFETIASERGNTGYDRILAESEWTRTPDNPAATINLPFSLAPTTDTLFVETDNGDNPPLALDAARVSYPVTRLLFKTDFAPPTPNGTAGLTLYYGNPEAGAPRYDFPAQWDPKLGIHVT